MFGTHGHIPFEVRITTDQPRQQQAMQATYVQDFATLCALGDLKATAAQRFSLTD
jgi:hypothetical protein